MQEDIKKKVAAVLAKTPLEIKPRKAPIDLDRKDSIGDTLPPPILPIVLSDPTSSQAAAASATDATTAEGSPESNPAAGNFYSQNLQLQLLNLDNEKEKEKAKASPPNKLQLNVTPSIETPDAAAPSEIKPSQSSEFLSPSPVFGFGSFDAQSLDGFTPDDPAQSQLLGLSNVNYDIDFSDISADNSVAEDASPEKRKSPLHPDPFSPVGSRPSIDQTPLIPAKVEAPKKADDSFKLPFVDNDSAEKSLLDETENSVAENLPSPIKPLGYMGFSRQGWQIPIIPCNTGDYSSLSCENVEGAHAVGVGEGSATAGANGATGGANGASAGANGATGGANGTDGAGAGSDGTGESKGAEKSGGSSKREDAVVKVLSGVLDTFDKLF